MSYVHWAIAHVKDSDGRSLNLTGTPTITVYNVATEAAIASPVASIVNLETGLYKVKITLDAITPITFKLVPHADDLATVADIAMVDTGIEQMLESLPTAAEIWEYGMSQVLPSLVITARSSTYVTVLQVLEKVVPILMQSAVGTQTAASATVLTDAVRLPFKKDDHWNDGYAVLLNGTQAGAVKRVTDYVGSTYAATVGAGWSSVAIGTRFLLFKDRWSLGEIIEAINRAMDTVGRVLLEDESLVLVDGQSEYDLPVGVNNVREVELERPSTSSGTVGSTGEETWKHRYWEEVASEGVLRFYQHPPQDNWDTIRLRYAGFNAAVADLDDVIYGIELERMAWETAAVLAETYFYNGQVDDKYQGLIAMVNQRRQAARVRYPIRLPVVQRWGERY